MVDATAMKIISATFLINISDDEFEAAGASELNALLDKIGFAGSTTCTTTPDIEDPDSNLRWVNFDPVEK